MKVTHEFTMRAVCPVDGKSDLYAVTVETDRLLKIEDILGEISAAAEEPDFQENITVDLARRLGAHVTTIGVHTGIKTTVIV